MGGGQLKNKEQLLMLCTITALFQEKYRDIKRLGNSRVFLSKIVGRSLLLNFCLLLTFQRINRRRSPPVLPVIWRVSASIEEPSLLASSPRFLCHLRSCYPSAVKKEKQI